MKVQTSSKSQVFSRQYSVAIETVPLPDKPEERVRMVIDQITPIINEIVADAMTVAIGAWPTPEKPIKNQ